MRRRDVHSTKVGLVAVGAFLGLLLLGATSQRAFAIAYLDLSGSLEANNSQGPYGWVGKGGVQNAFDPIWNNKNLQDRAGAVDFVLEQTAEYSVTVQWFSEHGSGTDQTDADTVCVPTGGPPGPAYLCTETHTATQTKTTNIDASVNAEPRQSPKQFTGFKLNSATTTTTGDAIPEVGDSCPNGGPDSGCTVTEVTQTGGYGANFYAVWDNDGNSTTDPIASNPIPVSIL